MKKQLVLISGRRKPGGFGKSTDVQIKRFTKNGARTTQTVRCHSFSENAKIGPSRSKGCGVERTMVLRGRIGCLCRHQRVDPMRFKYYSCYSENEFALFKCWTDWSISSPLMQACIAHEFLVIKSCWEDMTL